MTVVALAGRKSSGKSTVAAWLVKHRGFKELPLAAELKSLAALLFPRSVPARVADGPSAERDRAFSHDELRQAAQELTAAGTLLKFDPDAREALAKLFAGAPEPVTHRRAADQLGKAFVPYEERLASPRKILQYLGTEWGRALWDEVWLNAVRRTVDANRHQDYVVPDCRFRNEADYLRGRLGARVYWLDADGRLGPNKDAHASEPRRADLVDLCAGEIDTAGALEATHARLETLFPKAE